MSSQVTLSTDEVIATLNKTSLPTVIIEGVNDVIVYRRLEEHFYENGLSVLGVGGRVNLLKIFDRAKEITSDNLVAFIADKDLWCITGIPEKYQSKNLLFTGGYSIENDIFQDARVLYSMDDSERKSFHLDIERYSHWYSLMVKRKIDDEPHSSLNTFPENVLRNNDYFNQEVELKVGESYPVDLRQQVLADYSGLLRGKSLMQIASTQLNRKGRLVKINTDFYLGTASANPGPNLMRLYRRVAEIFDFPLVEFA